MANTTQLKDNRILRKALKRSQRKALKLVDVKLTAVQRGKLRRARKEKKVGLRQFLATNKD